MADGRSEGEGTSQSLGLAGYLFMKGSQPCLTQDMRWSGWWPLSCISAQGWYHGTIPCKHRPAPGQLTERLYLHLEERQLAIK